MRCSTFLTKWDRQTSSLWVYCHNFDHLRVNFTLSAQRDSLCFQDVSYNTKMWPAGASLFQLAIPPFPFAFELKACSCSPLVHILVSSPHIGRKVHHLNMAAQLPWKYREPLLTMSFLFYCLMRWGSFCDRRTPPHTHSERQRGGGVGAFDTGVRVCIFSLDERIKTEHVNLLLISHHNTFFPPPTGSNIKRPWIALTVKEMYKDYWWSAFTCRTLLKSWTYFYFKDCKGISPVCQFFAHRFFYLSKVLLFI